MRKVEMWTIFYESKRATDDWLVVNKFKIDVEKAENINFYPRVNKSA